MKKDYCRILRRGGFLLVALTFCLLTACSNLWKEEISDNTENQKQSGEFAYITLGSAGFSQAGARDIFPSATEFDKTQLTDISLSGTWSPDTDNSRTETFIESAAWSTASSSTFAVQTGQWNFTLTAKLNGGSYSGTITNKTITKGDSPTSLTFTLEPYGTGGSGALALTVKILNYSDAIPDDTTLTVSATLEGASGTINADASAEEKTYSGSNITFSRNISSTSQRIPDGVYKLKLSLTVDGISQAITEYTETIHIFPGVTTTSTIEMNVSPVYDIAYQKNGGQLVPTGTEGPAKFSRKAAEADLPELQKIGYNFLGWFDANTGGNEVDSVSNEYIDTTAQTTTFFARFQVITYDVILNGTEGASIPGGTSLPVNYTIESETISLPVLTKPYYTFVGWYESVDENGNGTGTQYSEISSGSTGTKTFYATWTPVNYPINYENIESASGTGSLPSSYTVESEDITLPSISKTGYAFEGWYTDSAFTPSYKVSGVAIESGSHEEKTYYARFIDTVYVKAGGETYSTTADGTRTTAPLDTVASAVSKIMSYSKNTVDWKINVIGEITGVQELSSSCTSTYAKSITLQGNTGNTTDIINANFAGTSDKGSALKILAKVKVTIKNLKITGGIPNGGTMQGGGVTVYGNADVIFDTGALITNNNYDPDDTNTSEGGGVYIREGGKLTIKAGASVEHNNAKYGGGISDYGALIMEGGKITENTAVNTGGGIYIRSDTTPSTCTIQGGEISSNTGNNGPAIGGVNYDATVTISGGEIKNNISKSSTVSDAAVHFMPKWVCSITGGIFTGNTGESAKGSIFICTDTSCAMSGSFYVSKENPIVCQSMNNKPGKIAITGAITPPDECTDGLSANIKEILSNTEVYNAGDQLIDFSQWSDVTSAEKTTAMSHCKLVTAADGGRWQFDEDGKLVKNNIGVKDAPDAIGDIVFADGTATAYSATLTLTDEQKAAAVAVIFYKGTECNNSGESGNRLLGVGLTEAEALQWNQSLSPAQSISIETVVATFTGEAGSYSFTGVVNGKNNLSLISQYLDSQNKTNDTDDPEKYSAFYFGINYKDQPGSRVAESGFKTGWYLPSIAELYQMGKAYDNNNLAEAIALCEGTTFTASTKAYISSTQDAQTDATYQDGQHLRYNFIGKNIFGAGKDYNNAVNCAIRQFN